MYRVLIADDEKNVCYLINKIIDWESLGLEVISMVHNAVEAYDCIINENPDIVISDIRMPGYDGLELIKKAMDYNNKIQFIIISGYKYFEYAHKALGLGVEYYLLKPISQMELEDSLIQIVEKKKKEEEETKAQEYLEQEIYQNQKRFKKHFLTSILSYEDYDSNMELLKEEFSMNFSEAYFQAFFVKVDFPANENQELKALLKIVESNIDKVLRSTDCEYINSVMKSGVVSIINFNIEQENHILSLYEKMLHQIQYELNKFQSFTGTMGVGLKVSSISLVKASINSAVEAVKCRIKKGLGKVVFSEELHYQKVDIDQLLDVKAVQRFENMIEALDKSSFQSYFNTIYQDIREVGFYSPVSLFQLMERVENIVIQVFEKNQVDQEVIRKLRNRLELVYDMNVKEEPLIRSFEETIKVAMEVVIQGKKNQSQLPVRLAKQYIQEHYWQPLTLEGVGTAIHLSPAYLSTLFKKEMGINFTDYVISCRMDAAKDLLKQREVSIAEVAEQVGYLDPRYFSKLFVKVVGVKPSVYRKLYT